MNWQEIKEKYPKGWELYRQNDKLYGTHNVNYNSHRIFYDFFDEQGIYISIMTYINNPANWGFTVAPKSVYNNEVQYSGDDYESTIEFNSRTEAEEQAFEKAFEILEGKL